MAARRRESDEISGLLARVFGQSEAGIALTLLSIFLVFLAVGTYLAWSHFGGYVMSQPSYQIASDSIEVTPQPAWITQTDVKQESIQAGSLSGMNIRQPDLTLRVAQTFSMHPWVYKVRHVSKRHPARVIVDLDYRRPVGMVEVDGKYDGRSTIGYFPVDTEGVILPSSDFSVDAVEQYLLISAGGQAPISQLAGTSWGDDRVIGAATLAGFLQPFTGPMGLRKVVAYRGPQYPTGNADCYFVVLTRSGTAIVWGRAPGREVSSEPVAEQKIERLKDFAKQRGGLDVLEPGQSIDLRRSDRLSVATMPEEFAK